MSATPPGDGPPTPDELAARFPISATEAQIIADAMSPLQDLTGIGSSVGDAMENAPGAGPPFVGSVLKTIALQVNLASQSAETIARAIDFYLTAQGEAAEELFPPPEVIAEQLEENARVLQDLAQGPESL